MPGHASARAILAAEYSGQPGRAALIPPPSAAHDRSKASGRGALGLAAGDAIRCPDAARRRGDTPKEAGGSLAMVPLQQARLGHARQICSRQCRAAWAKS